MIFFTSDHHFGHANIIQYCERPFGSVEEMDFEMIHRWNVAVDHSDTVYHLGDFCLGGADLVTQYFARLNGSIKILSNPWHHDRRWLSATHSGFYTTSGNQVRILPPMIVLEFPQEGEQYPQAIVLCHYPLAVWDRQHYGAWHLHGHSHGKHEAQGRILDVGVDSTSFCPISLDEVAHIMRTR